MPKNTHQSKLKVLISVYSCGPNQGSEPGIGWNWVLALANRGHEVYAVTRGRNRQAIEAALAEHPNAQSIHFLYHDDYWPRKHSASGAVANIAYSRWQKSLMSFVAEAHKTHRFDLCHHLTFGSWRQHSDIWKLEIPFIFGPVGGGEEAPRKLVSQFAKKDRLKEIVRFAWNRVALFDPALKRCVKKAVSLPTKTRETSRFIEKIGGTPFVSLELGIDSTKINHEVSKRQSGYLKCIFVGRIIEWKGIRLAIHTIKELRQSGQNVYLTVVGKGELSHELQEFVRKSDLVDYVKFVGSLPQSQVFALYKAHDVMLFPSLHDSSGNVVLEAFAHGLPVVCLDLGGPGAMVSGDNGIAVPVSHNWQGTVSSLSEAVKVLLHDEQLRITLAKGAIASAQDMTWDKAVERVYAAVESRIKPRQETV